MCKVVMAVLFCSIPLFWSCATIASGTSQTLTINSDPPGASVVFDGVEIGLTPLAPSIKRGNNRVLLIKKEGFQEEEIRLSTQFNTIFFGNILFGGLFGSTTDVATDAVVEYSPTSYFVTLKPTQSSQIEETIFSKERKIRNFVLLTYHHLTSDIFRGEGEYLSGLYAAIDVEEGEKPEALGYLREMLVGHENVPAFGEGVVRRFHRGGEITEGGIKDHSGEILGHHITNTGMKRMVNK